MPFLKAPAISSTALLLYKIFCFKNINNSFKFKFKSCKSCIFPIKLVV